MLLIQQESVGHIGGAHISGAGEHYNRHSKLTWIAADQSSQAATEQSQSTQSTQATSVKNIAAIVDAGHEHLQDAAS